MAREMNVNQSFIEGARWADKHPKEEENKMMENYVKYQKKQFIEKACEWLISKSTIENSSNVNIFVNGASYHSVYDFIKDFQKAMEE